MTEGVDYAGSRPDPGKLASAGKVFVCRYGGPGGSWKHLTASEAKALTAAGLWLVANAEGTARGLSGRSAGADWARSADAAFRQLGMPPGRPIYLSADWDVTAGEWPAVAEALRGAASVLGPDRVGVYGSYNVVTWAARDGVARWLWQTYAWSGGRWHAGNHIEQYHNGVTVAGGDVDLCRARTADYGQWQPGRSAAATTKETDMQLSDKIVGTDSPTRTLGNLATDLANLRNFEVSEPGHTTKYDPAPTSRIGRLMAVPDRLDKLESAVEKLTTPQPIDYDALAAALLRTLAKG